MAVMGSQDERAPRRGDFKEPVFSCPRCLDESSGWALRWCCGEGEHRRWEVPSIYTAVEKAECGRVKDHGPHAYCVRCDCWQHNPSVIERKRKMAEGAVRARRNRA